MHQTLQTAAKGLHFPRQESQQLRRNLALQFVRLSTATRDFTIEFTYSKIRAGDVKVLRNEIQGLIRAILALKPSTSLFDAYDEVHGEPADTIRQCLAGPVGGLLEAMRDCILATDMKMLNIAGLTATAARYGQTLPLHDALAMLKTSQEAFDRADARLLEEGKFITACKGNIEVIELFLFVHPVRQAADTIMILSQHVLDMQKRCYKWRIQAPSYPWYKAINRSNPQVRHDRGGLTAGFYFRTKRSLERTMASLLNDDASPAKTLAGKAQAKRSSHEQGVDNEGDRTTAFRYTLWLLLHRLQGFESRFALKVTLTTTLLSIPAWLPQSRGWWNNYESWWTVVTVWLMMHPRVGGTFQDLFTRCFCAAIGAVWGGLAFRAGNGNPYVMAVFAVAYLIPMLHRFTQSSHPRSGFIGCVSFVVISLDTYTAKGRPSIVQIVWTRGLAFVVGIVAAVIVNWVLWPFIARHELRKSISAMMLHSAILYRGLISKCVYYAEGEAPGPQDIERSEMLEGRLREGFVRMRQLLELTRHEIVRFPISD